MANITEPQNTIEIPNLPPAGVQGFIKYLTKSPKTPIVELLKPYKAFEAELRKAYAQQPSHEILKDGRVNLVPVFDGNEEALTIRARNLDEETEEEREKFILALSKEERLPHGAPAIVSSFRDFRKNFNLFSESSLTDLDWSNVVAAGSAVTTALLPVPEKWAGSKRSLREYYHQHLAPASDVDLFIYGLNEEQALEKIKQIERNVKDSILHETTTIRTKNAITIASQYPTRHIQIVLRLYDSVSQIITGFDVDSACVAYDGKQVYAAPRAITAFITQCNTIDLTRRSPSYENRLSKYSHRGFEAHWPLLDRSRIDPTIFERSFGRTQGLARLLILEKLPKSADRDSYMDQRRAERGRPTLYRRNQHRMGGNIKDEEEDEIAEWVDQEEVASYHTMTVPYGEKYNAARINRLLYAKDLLLNAEWNQQDDREVYLHRHPCFFGTAEEVLQDCCGYCPVPKTDKEIEIAEEEIKTNVSGALKFLKDDPGRQEIGSFNPITDDEWTTMAYIGDTARLCQAIVDKDLEHVEDWCAQEGVDVNQRDYTGRTPLHLACMTSSVEVVKCLIDNGARLIARLVDGRTALHLAAARGDADMVKALMDKSLANEEEEEAKADAKRAAKKPTSNIIDNDTAANTTAEESNEAEEDSFDSESEGTDESDSMTMGSFVKIDKDGQDKANDGVPEDSLDDPDVYEINVIAWDYGLSPLHLAILNGHTNVVELLVSEYGADVLLPVKLVDPGTTNANGAIMTIVLALSLPADMAKEMIKLLLKLGATSAQGDMNHVTAFHYVVAENNEYALDLLLDHDRPVALSVLNNLSYSGSWAMISPLQTAVAKGHKGMTKKLLELGAQSAVLFEDWAKGYLAKNPHANSHTAEQNLKQYQNNVYQPIISAASKEYAEIVEDLLGHGADPNTLNPDAWKVLENRSNSSYFTPEAVLDIIQRKLKALRDFKPEEESSLYKPEIMEEEHAYTSGISKVSFTGYQLWTASEDYKQAKQANNEDWERYQKAIKEQSDQGLPEKQAAITSLIEQLEHAEKTLIAAGGKTFKDLHFAPNNSRNYNRYGSRAPRVLPWYKTTFTFQDPTLNDIKKEGYITMFEAAWNGDLETIKSLTLAPWESTSGGSTNIPLRVAVQDGNGFSPFSIAVLRGHFDLAEKIVEISIAQYHEDGSSKRRRWTMKPIERDDDDDEDSDYEHDNDIEHAHLPIFSELVSDKYTVDNLGEIASTVKSNVLPLTMIEWSCYTTRILTSDQVAAAKGSSQPSSNRQNLLEHAVVINDMKLLKFILTLGADQQARLAEEEDAQTSYTVPTHVFLKAIELGRTAMLAEMIRLTGVGIPLNELIKTSGIELKTKPRYYQGLSVGGKKRADWAQAPGTEVKVIEERIPPLLQAAHVGSIESVEWFMSDAPMRRYKEFAARNEKNKRIKTLAETKKGFEKTIHHWLSEKSELALHCAILYNPTDDSKTENYLDLIKHLLSVTPEALEQKSSEGWTPLQVALFAQREDVITHLISVGANQRHRDKLGRNMMHTMLLDPNQLAHSDPEKLRSLMTLFNKEAIKEMLLERCSIAPGALTPLALWMARSGAGNTNTKFIKVLSEYSDGGDLEMINGEGDLPLHVAIKQGMSSITSFLLSLNPSLLHRENATGRTPLEMSRDMFLASCVTNAPNIDIQQHNSQQDEWNSMARRPAVSFLPNNKAEESKKRTYDICMEVDEQLSVRKRRLVSLFEANEVAKRLAGSRKGRGGTVANGGLVEDGKRDVVSEWIGSGVERGNWSGGRFVSSYSHYMGRR